MLQFQQVDFNTGVNIRILLIVGLFQLTQSLIRKLTPTIDKFLFGGMLLVSQLMLVLMLMLDANATEFLPVEYPFARFQNTVCNFVERWNTYNVLCKVENDNIIFDI